MRSVSILGAGGHTRSLMSLLRNCSFNVLGIYDESYDVENIELINEAQVLGGLYACDFKKEEVVLSFGDNNKRKKLYTKYLRSVLSESLVHSTSFVDETAELGASNFIFAKSIINSNAKIGVNNIINTGAIVEHESHIGSHNHISVGSIVCGRATIGDNCFLGAGSVVIDKVQVCSDVTVGANAVVIKSIDVPGVYAGNPARRIS